MRTTRLLLILLAAVFCITASGERSQAYISLLDGNLEINGYFKEQWFIRTGIPNREGYHKSKIDYMRSILLAEGLYKLKKDGDLTVNLFGGFKYYYEKAPAFDSDKKRGMFHPTYSEYTHPRDDDLITELYVDFQYGPFQLKAGKQIVVWGETNMKQTADIINPLDLRYGSPGTETWEDIKIGLYMLRGIYQSELPGQLNFEFLFIPGDFEATRLPNEGTYQGAKRYQGSFDPDEIFGINEWSMEKARHDEPGWNISNWEAAFKIRGFTGNVDWSIFYFNTLSDSPQTDPSTYNDLALSYVGEFIGSSLTGRDFDPKMPETTVFKFKRYEVIGATFQTRFEDFPVSEWRLETFYYIGEPMNKGTDAKDSGTYAAVRRDSFGFALEGRDYYTIPYITHNWFDDKKLTASVTLFYEKIFNHDHDLIVRKGRGHRTGDSHASEIAWSFSQYFNHSKWFMMFTGSYNFIGKWFALPVLAYAPGQHWRFEGGYAMYGSSASSNKGLNHKDSLLLRVRYEF